MPTSMMDSRLISASADREATAWWLQQASIPEGSLQARRPDFLVISPPKTGSTWLALNLGCHPNVFVPEVKEIKYFSTWFKWFDLDWYLEHFAAAPGRVKGEASPSYATLPTRRIRLIRELFPDIKLIYLMREPIGRAWSHAKHNQHYREANFAKCRSEMSAVTSAQWLENFTHDWPLTAGDYLGQLKRWLAIFPKEQLFVGFYEEIARRPEALLRRLFTFLGVEADRPLTEFPLNQRIQPGPAGELAGLQREYLHSLFHQRTVELAAYLEREFDIALPTEWHPTLTPPLTQASVGIAEPFARSADDEYLSRINAMEELFPAATKSVIKDYRGYHIVFHDGRFYALRTSLGRACPAELSPFELERLQNDGQCFVAGSLASVKESVSRRVHEEVRLRLEEANALRSEILETRERLTKLERVVAEQNHCLERAVADLATFRPWFYFANRCLRPVWRWVRSALQSRFGRRGAAPSAVSISKGALVGSEPFRRNNIETIIHSN